MSCNDAPSGPNPSSAAETTTKSMSSLARLNGNAGRPRISSAQSPMAIGHGAASIAARTALAPLYSPMVIVFQIGACAAVTGTAPGAAGTCAARACSADRQHWVPDLPDASVV